MRIAAQFPHFYEDKQGESHRNMLQIEVDDPEMKNNYPDDGSIMIRLKGEDEQKAFKLDPQEALAIGEQLRDISTESMRKKRELWEKKNKN